MRGAIIDRVGHTGRAFDFRSASYTHSECVHLEGVTVQNSTQGGGVVIRDVQRVLIVDAAFIKNHVEEGTSQRLSASTFASIFVASSVPSPTS